MAPVSGVADFDVAPVSGVADSDVTQVSGVVASDKDSAPVAIYEVAPITPHEFVHGTNIDDSTRQISFYYKKICIFFYIFTSF